MAKPLASEALEVRATATVSARLPAVAVFAATVRLAVLPAAIVAPVTVSLEFTLVGAITRSSW